MRDEIKPARATAPGRLDFLGGVADYSGAYVLQTPTAGVTTVTVEPWDRRRIALSAEGFTRFEMPLETLTIPDPEAFRHTLSKLDAPDWTRYPLGCLYFFRQETGCELAVGMRLTTVSSVPPGMGVSSSAALEIATLKALEAAYESPLDPVRRAHLGQWAENRIVGAPCGLMDQLASSAGKRGALLPIRCQPDLIDLPVPLSEGTTVLGWPSGVVHSVSGDAYGRARASAFMGRRIFEAVTGKTYAHAALIAPEVFSERVEEIPERMSGHAFTERYGSLANSISRVVAEADYFPRAALGFPIRETARAERIVSLLRHREVRGTLEAKTEIGQLLYESHADYTAIGLGHPQTDAMVAAVRGLGPEKGCYGARVSGGGAGGTVVVFCEAGAESLLLEQARALGTPTEFVRQAR